MQFSFSDLRIFPRSFFMKTSETRIVLFIGGRCIGPTGSIDLTEMRVGSWPHKQKDRLAAVSPKSDQVF